VIEAEVGAFLRACAEFEDDQGRRRLVRNGHAPAGPANGSAFRRRRRLQLRWPALPDRRAGRSGGAVNARYGREATTLLYTHVSAARHPLPVLPYRPDGQDRHKTSIFTLTVHIPRFRCSSGIRSARSGRAAFRLKRRFVPGCSPTACRTNPHRLRSRRRYRDLEQCRRAGNQALGPRPKELLCPLSRR
jgi:hypothetical protein